MMAALAAVLAGACGGGGGATDPPVDAAPQGCPIPAGESYFMASLEFAPEADGFDLDNDGVVDNSLGRMPVSVLASMNDGIATEIETGEIMLAHVLDWSPPTATDPAVELWLFTGRDADDPPDPSNNASGGAEFYAKPTQFDVNCLPETRTSSGNVIDSVLRGRADDWLFPLASVGAVNLATPRLELTFASDFASFSGRLGAVVPLCSLSAVPLLGQDSGTMLDAMVNGPSIRGDATIDVDRDGDGLEVVEGDGVGILRCIDGDGTIINGSDCPCDPRIVDGYSMALKFTGVSAKILGALP